MQSMERDFEENHRICVNTEKADITQKNYCNRGKETSALKWDPIPIQHGQVGIYSQESGYGPVDGKLTKRKLQG